MAWFRACPPCGILGPMSHAEAIAKGIKLLELYRRGVGGERQNAGRLLLGHLRSQDLTLYDLDASLPVTQNLDALDNWRESASLLTRLGTPEQDEVLARLVDAEDLTEPEMARLLGAVELSTLADLRADGWAYSASQPHLAQEYRRAAQSVTSADVLRQSGSLAQRLQRATLQAHWRQTHPQRLLRADDDLGQRFLLGLVQAVSGEHGEAVPGGVQAYLDAQQLARLRALQAQGQREARERALAAAEAYGASLS